MTTSHFSSYADAIRGMSGQRINDEVKQAGRLRMWPRNGTGRDLEIAYAPFDYVNPAARVVLVGITPGPTQMQIALGEASRLLRQGKDPASIARAVKVHGSFAGEPMRSNLIRQLNYIGVPRLLGIADASSLWATDSHLVHFTSCVRYPVFSGGKAFNGDPMEVPILRTYAERYLGEEMRALPHAIWLVLGDRQCGAVRMVAKGAGLPRNQILTGLYHPSRNCTDRIRHFVDAAYVAEGLRPGDYRSAEERRRRILPRMARLIGEADAAPTAA